MRARLFLASAVHGFLGGAGMFNALSINPIEEYVANDSHTSVSQSAYQWKTFIEDDAVDERHFDEKTADVKKLERFQCLLNRNVTFPLSAVDWKKELFILMPCLSSNCMHE